MLKKAKRDSHIDPPASSNAIMRRARPYRGENLEPGKDVTESLTPRPELENSQDPAATSWLTGSKTSPDPYLIGHDGRLSVLRVR